MLVVGAYGLGVAITHPSHTLRHGIGASQTLLTVAASASYTPASVWIGCYHETKAHLQWMAIRGNLLEVSHMWEIRLPTQVSTMAPKETQLMRQLLINQSRGLIYCVMPRHSYTKLALMLAACRNSISGGEYSSLGGSSRRRRSSRVPRPVK